MKTRCRSISRILSALITGAALLALTACTTADPNADSDLPWNTPQQWEGAPSIPGMNGY